MSQKIPWISKDIAETAAATLVMTKYFQTEEFTRYLICLKIGLCTITFGGNALEY